MLTARHIIRSLHNRAYAQLINQILTNGRWCGRDVLALLSRPAGAVPTASGLALQRVAELNYGSPAPLTDIAIRLLLLQRKDGTYGRDPMGSVAVTAVALRGLIDYNEAAAARPGPAMAQLGSEGIERGMAALAARQTSEGHIGENPVESAIVLWQLGDIPAFREAVRLDDLIRSVEHDVGAAESTSPDLSRVAKAVAA